MRVLCIDHFFEQDIEALAGSAGEHHCWAVGYERFLQLAGGVFEEEVFTGISEFFEPRHEQDRRRYAALASKELDRLLRQYRFDALVAPSDTFFWIRAVIVRAQELGIPFVVLQKEATIPPGWLEGPAREWGEISPFIADHMLVSSEHHRQFWINSGVAPELVTVTGQPRFDVYATPGASPSWAELGVPTEERPTVLFLTYDSNAYLPVIDRTGLHPWLELRSQTEAVLLELAASGGATVLVKGHPQPAEDQSAHLAELARSPGVQVLDPTGDVRHFIANADVVVGFQTTAMFEALAAGRPAVYTWWTDAVNDYTADLIPFHEEQALDVARSPEELRMAIERGLEDRSEAHAAERRERARPLVERYLGPVDGRAGARSWSVLEGMAPARPAPERSSPLRAAAAASASAVWGLGSAAVPVAYPLYRGLTRLRRRPEALPRERFQRELRVRRDRARDRLQAATAR